MTDTSRFRVRPGDLSFLSQKADLGRRTILSAALKPNDRKDPPLFTASRLSGVFKRDRSTVTRAIEDLKLGVDREPGTERFALTLEDAHAIGSHLGVISSIDAPGVVAGVINQKGGVGKTTTTAHLAHFAALHKLRVLIVDLDSQASLTSTMGYSPDVEISQDQTAYPVLVGNADSLEPVILPCPNFPNIHFIPSCLDLSAANEVAYGKTLLDVERAKLAREHGFEYKPSGFTFWNRLKAALDPLRARYDLILLDCPPHLSTPSFNAVVASDILVIPLAANMPDLASTLRFLNWLDENARKKVIETLCSVQFVVTNFDNSSAAIEAIQSAEKILGGFLSANVAHQSSEIQRAAMVMKTIYELPRPLGSRGAWTRAAESMDDINREILDNVQNVRLSRPTLPSTGA